MLGREHARWASSLDTGLRLPAILIVSPPPLPPTLEGGQPLTAFETPARLSQKENLILGAFSVLYTINIAVSNISLQLVTVPVSTTSDATRRLFLYGHRT